MTDPRELALVGKVLAVEQSTADPEFRDVTFGKDPWQPWQSSFDWELTIANVTWPVHVGDTITVNITHHPATDQKANR